MPMTAFADLWSVIQAGRLWRGYVANQLITERIYWVKTSVSPGFENGKNIGYVSIRTKPGSDIVKNAAEASLRDVCVLNDTLEQRHVKDFQS